MRGFLSKNHPKVYAEYQRYYETEMKELQRKAAARAAAFASAMSSTCSCPKSRCLTLYCICFSEGVACRNSCKCKFCANPKGVAVNIKPAPKEKNKNATAATEVAAAAIDSTPTTVPTQVQQPKSLSMLTVTPGLLGITLSMISNDEFGGAEITRIDPECTFGSQVEVGDRVVTIDGESVTKLQDFLVAKDRERKLGILRKSDIATTKTCDTPSPAALSASAVVDSTPAQVQQPKSLRFITVKPGQLGLTLSMIYDKFGGAEIMRIDPECTFPSQVEVGDRVMTIDGKSVTKLQDFLVAKDGKRTFGILKKSDITATKTGDTTPVAQSAAAVELDSIPAQIQQPKSPRMIPPQVQQPKSLRTIPPQIHQLKSFRFITIRPGVLGLTLSIIHDKFGGAEITRIDPVCTFRSQVEVGDRVITIDGVPVKRLKDFLMAKDGKRTFGILKKSNSTLKATTTATGNNLKTMLAPASTLLHLGQISRYIQKLKVPPGRLGLTLSMMKDDVIGGAEITRIDRYCTLLGQVMVGDRVLTINGERVHDLQDFVVAGVRTFGIMKKSDILKELAVHAVLPGGGGGGGVVGSSAAATTRKVDFNTVRSGGGGAGSLALTTSMKPNDCESSESSQKKAYPIPTDRSLIMADLLQYDRRNNINVSSLHELYSALINICNRVAR